MKSFGLAKKYLITETFIAIFELIFGFLSSCLATSALGLYSLIGVFCVLAIEHSLKPKITYIGFIPLTIISVVLSWVALYKTYLTIGYADSAVKLWGLIPPIIVFFVKACFLLIFSDSAKILEKTFVFKEIIDFKYDFLLIFSTVLCIFLTFIFDFYTEYIAALGIFLCCIRKISLSANLTKKAPKNLKT